MLNRSRALFLIIALGVAAVCVRLAFWQLHRLHDRRAANAVAYAARDLPPVPLPGPHPALIERRVSARGVYDHEHDFVVRGRVYKETPGVEIVTPLRLPGTDTALLVLRGFVPSADAVGADPDTLREPGEHLVSGIALPLESARDSGAPRAADGRITWRDIDHGMARALPYPVYPVFLLQVDDPSLPRWPRRLTPPVLDEGPHKSYAIQWFGFALIFGIGGIVWVWRTGADAPRE